VCRMYSNASHLVYISVRFNDVGGVRLFCCFDIGGLLSMFSGLVFLFFVEGKGRGWVRG
jgi:hypothetical protein